MVRLESQAVFVCGECGLALRAAGTGAARRAADLAQPTIRCSAARSRAIASRALLGDRRHGPRLQGVQPDDRQPRRDQGAVARVHAIAEDCVERFFAEARAVNLIRHENIVNVLDLAVLPDGRPYIVMEYLDGAAARRGRRARSASRCRSAASCRLVVEVLDALGAAHANGHRPPRPQARQHLRHADGPREGARLRHREARARHAPALAATRPASLLGTPQYMAPEQSGGAPTSTRAPTSMRRRRDAVRVRDRAAAVRGECFELMRTHVERRRRRPRAAAGHPRARSSR